MTDLRTIALEELAKAQREVERWRAVLVELGPDTVPDDDLDFVHAISAKEAAHRFSMDETTIRRWCRDEGIGRPRGNGQWEVSIKRLEGHLKHDRIGRQSV